MPSAALTYSRSLALLLALAIPACAQQPMGTASTSDALVTGGLEVHGEQARLLSNASITAYDHTASIELDRGGKALVCSTSQFHLLHSGSGASLLFGLDRGAIELHSPSAPQDVILTPDIRFTVEAPGDFNLTLRVTAAGDTCVDNAGAHAPVLVLTDPFSASTYRLIPGQHVLFEHGNLHEVVDNERTSCGCPEPATAPVLSAAATPAEKAAADHPFPAAVSAGLAAPPATVPLPAGETHTQIDTTFTHGDSTPPRPPAPSSPPPPPPPALVSTAPPPSPPGVHDLAHAIGHFFHKLFHPHS
jgi:hypothetical protein